MSYYSKADKERIAKFRHIGCIITGSPQYEVHHIVEGRKRLGNQYTIPLHPWFHRGVPLPGLNQDGSEKAAGPSLAKNRAAFEAKFGTERELLAKVNELIGETK